MAYTNSGWPTNIPAGTDALNTADNQLRRMRLDLLERLNDIISDITADPVISNTGIVKIYHWTAGIPADETFALLYNRGSGAVVTLESKNTSNLLWYMPLYLPVGAVFQSVVFRVYQDSSSATITCAVNRISDVPEKTQLGTVSSSGTPSWHNLTVGSLAHTVLAGSSYFASISLTPNAAGTEVRFVHMNVTYDRSFALQGL